MTINIPLLEQTLAHIEAHPESWSQSDYRSAAGMCFAGLACELAGGVWLYSNPERGDALMAEREDLDSLTVRPDGPYVTDAYTRATRILGLSMRQADDLFAPDNTLDALRRLVAQIREEAAA